MQDPPVEHVSEIPFGGYLSSWRLWIAVLSAPPADLFAGKVDGTQNQPLPGRQQHIMKLSDATIKLCLSVIRFCCFIV